MDKLESIFQMQQALNRDITERRNLEAGTGEAWLQKYAMATYVELGEMLQETNYKWWKNQKPVDMDKVREELVDVLHFFVCMCLSAGMDAEDLYQKYMDKNKENFLRQQGAGQKPGYDIREQQ